MKKNQRRPTLGTLTSLLVCFLSWPDAAWALQTHPAPEGLYGHMLAHLFFIASLAIFTYWLHTTRLTRQRGWLFIQISCFLFILWNVDTFSVHWVEHTMVKEMFIATGLDWSMRLTTTGDWRSWVYYLGKFDHLLCVPAMLFLLGGLRDLCRQAGSEGLSNND